MKYPDKGFQWIGKCNIDKRAEAVVCSKKATKKEKASEYLRIMLSVEDVPSAEIIRRMDRIGIKEVGVYARVSTKSTNRVSSIENQTRYYTKKVGDTPNWTLHEIYSDEGKN